MVETSEAIEVPPGWSRGAGVRPAPADFYEQLIQDEATHRSLALDPISAHRAGRDSRPRDDSLAGQSC
jgi:hypothetical protein